jgi:hypothetical protein
VQSGNLEGAIEADLRAMETMGDALAGTDKPFVGTSGTLMLVLGGLEGVGTEADAVEAGPRVDAENKVIALAERGSDPPYCASRRPCTAHSITAATSQP